MRLMFGVHHSQCQLFLQNSGHYPVSVYFKFMYFDQLGLLLFLCSSVVMPCFMTCQMAVNILVP